MPAAMRKCSQTHGMLPIKAVRGITGRQRIVSAMGGYHGHTGLAVAPGDAQYRDPFGPNLPGFVQVPFDDLTALAAAVDGETAAVLLEPIPATLGMPIASDDYLPEVLALCRAHGAKLILDEVQTGLGRTGRMWCSEHQELQHWLTSQALPDVMGTSLPVCPFPANTAGVQVCLTARCSLVYPADTFSVNLPSIFVDSGPRFTLRPGTGSYQATRRWKTGPLFDVSNGNCKMS